MKLIYSWFVTIVTFRVVCWAIVLVTLWLGLGQRIAWMVLASIWGER